MTVNYLNYYLLLWNKSVMPSELKSCFHFVFQAPSQPPGNVVWNVTDSKIVLNWDQVRAMENESEVTGYKVREKKE